ncbi:hypothetical protein C0992_002653 [Termitomyces sp. T32_za158]|nr:hypothetical protein C0992_002653 [Termitomyces sp. T32_za158]
MAAKKAKFVRFRPLNIDDTKAWFPISVLLVSVIYTGSKSLVISSVIAAWPDIINAMKSSISPTNASTSLESFTGAVHDLNIGYLWMLMNCLASAGYVRLIFKMVLGGRWLTLIVHPTGSMVGALNKLPVAASGMIFFGDPVTLCSVSAVSVGFLAGLMYSVAKNNQKAVDQRKKADSLLPLTDRSQSLTERR